MKEVLSFLGDAHKPVSLATLSSGKPAVRMVSFKMYENGKIYFLTSKKKSVYKQLEQNPSLELCSLPNENREWVRLSGKAVFEDDISLKRKAFEVLPMLETAYQTPENEDVILFFVEEAKAVKYSFSKEPKILEF